MQLKAKASQKSSQKANKNNKNKVSARNFPNNNLIPAEEGKFFQKYRLVCDVM